MVKLLCQKATIKTGLSSYYVKLKDVSEVYGRMMDRINELPNIRGLGFVENCTSITSDTNHMCKLWEELEQFLQFEYSAYHIILDAPSKCHCYRYALNKTAVPADNPCCHEHNDNMCKSCLQPLTLFTKLHSLLCHINSQFGKCDDYLAVKNELTSMIKSATEIIEPTVKSYMAHRVRAMAQFVNPIQSHQSTIIYPI